MSTPYVISLSEFEQAWTAHRERRYGYALNRPLFALYTVLLGGFWAFWAYKLAVVGIDEQLSVIAVLFGIVSLFTVANAVWWSFVGRSSGIVCLSDRLIWRFGKEAWSVPWTAIDFDRLGIAEASQRQDEYTLRVAGIPLVLFRPHLRLVNFETFLAMTFMALKEHGRIPNRRSRS